VIKKIERFVENPYLNLLVGAMLFLSAVYEVGDTLYEDIFHRNVRVHHGIMIYSLFVVTQSMPDLFASLERVSQGVKKHMDKD
jgi:hypothetical protein